MEKKEIWPFPYEKIKKNLLTAPESLNKCIEYYFSSEGRELFSILSQKLMKLNFSRVVFVGNTFNYFSSLIPQNIMIKSQEHIEFCWETYELTEFYDYILPSGYDESTLFIFISKSGKSKLLKKSIEHLSLLKINPDLIWLITNIPNAEISKKCGFVFPICVDFEIVPSSKSFQNEIVVLYLISTLLLGKEPLTDEIRSIFDSLFTSMTEFRKSGKSTVVAHEILNFLGKDTNFLYCLSRGASLSSAYNSAHMGKTLAKIVTEGTSLGLFFHGPFQIADKDFRSIFIVGDDLGEGSDSILARLINSITQELSAGKVVLLSNNIRLNKIMLQNPRVRIIEFNCEEYTLSPIFEMFILHQFFLEVAKYKKLII